LLERARLFSRQGLVRQASEFVLQDEGPWHQEVHEFGLNYRLPDVLCALGLSQISKIQAFKESRRNIFNLYEESLSNIPDLILPTVKQYVDPMWHLYPIHVPSQKRRKTFEILRANGIGVQVNYLPAHLHPVFTRMGFRRGDFPESELFYDTQISLPMFANQEILGEAYFTKVRSLLKLSLTS
jgi:dTDP-4-amino-4,6-dideoxygalactose transaminase